MSGPARIAEALDMTPMTEASVTGVQEPEPFPDKVKEYALLPELHAQGGSIIMRSGRFESCVLVP